MDRYTRVYVPPPARLAKPDDPTKRSFPRDGDPNLIYWLTVSPNKGWWQSWFATLRRCMADHGTKYGELYVRGLGAIGGIRLN